jgi:ketosteroid isomerase-like protein
MKITSSFMAAGFVLLIINTSCKPSESGKPDFAKLESEVKEMFTRTMNLFQSKDLDGLVNRFTEDGSLKIPQSPLISGHDALRENYTGTIQLENFDLLLDVTKVDISKTGDIAYALADFSVSFNTPVGPFSDKGTSLMVLKRVNDEWKIVAENLSSGPAQ